MTRHTVDTQREIKCVRKTLINTCDGAMKTKGTTGHHSTLMGRVGENIEGSKSLHMLMGTHEVVQLLWKIVLESPQDGGGWGGENCDSIQLFHS